MSQVLVLIFLSTGVFFFAVGTLGLIRMPDALCRMHATTKCDTLGGGLILIALAIHSGSVTLALRLVLILVFLWMTNPVATHLLARSIYRAQSSPQKEARPACDGDK